MLRFAAVLLYVLLWSSGFIPSRVLLREVPPGWALVVRLIAAGGTLSLGAAAARLPFPRGRRQWSAAIAVGVMSNVVYLGLLYVALRHLSAGLAAIIASTNPLFLSLVAPRLLGEPITRAKALGMLVGFGGVAYVMAARAGNVTARPVDALLCTIAVLGLVGSTIAYKRGGFTPAAVAGVTGVQLLVGAVALLPYAILHEGAIVLPRSTDAWWAMAYLVLVMSVGASMLWFWLLSHGEATRVSAFYFLVPIVGLILSHLTLGESITPRDVVGAIGIAVGIAVVQRATARRVPTTA